MAETPVTSEAPVTPAIERAKATQDSVAVVEGKQREVKTEAKKDLVQLQQEFQTKQKSEGVNMKKHTEALKKTEYQKQVGYILGIESTDPVVLKQGIKDLQKALGFKGKAADGALGPKTFDALKVKWEKRDPPNQDYKTFIDGLIRPQAEKPAVTEPSSVTEQANTSAPAISEATGIKVPDMPRMPGSQTIDNNIPPINEKSDFGHIFDSARMITADGQYTINFELDGMIIDRDARKISESKDGQSYELNIGWKGDNVAIKKDELKYAIEQNRGDVKGITLPKNGEGKPVTIIINKERISDADRLKVPKLNVQTGDALRNADPANKGQVQNPTLNIQMNNFTDTMPEIQSGIVTSIEENMSNKTVDSAIPEPDTIVA